MQTACAAHAVTETRFRLLGPLEVTLDGRPAHIGGLLRRGVLALLLVAEGSMVSEDSLIDGLWGERPPQAARNSLQSHVSRLRAALGPEGGRLVREPGGYRLRVGREELDVRRVEALVAQARGSSPAEAVRLLAEAQAAWRGPALADAADLSGLQAERVRLDELRLVTGEELLDARLAAGDHSQVLPDAERAAAEQPLRERRHTLLALALYRCGRHADALDALRRYRARLADGTGLDPSEALTRLEAAILARDPALAAPAREPERPAAAPLFGRERELGRLVDALRHHRLVTVTGVGGVGKTRLALAVTPLVDGDAVVLDLAPLTRPEDVGPALAAVLGVRAGPSQITENAVIEYLGTQRLLLVADNCEHVLNAVRPLLDGIARRAPGVTVLATSREHLGLAAEQVFPLAPLPLPAADEVLRGRSDSPSVQLFADRATRVRPSFTMTADNLLAVAEICRRLDGLPLAIELAAGRVGSLGLADLRDRLDRRLDLLGGRAHDERHRTMRAVVDWSYGLLDDTERAVFAALAVFDGGFDLAAAEQVVGEDGVAHALARLVDASMVVAEDGEGGRLRYRLLDTLRYYGRERLADGSAVRRHTAWVLALVEEARQGLEGPDEAAWVRRIDAELANIRSAWHRAVEDGDLDTQARIVVALSEYALWRSRSELWAWSRRLADDPRLAGSELEVPVLGAASRAAWLQGDRAASRRLASEGLARAGPSPQRWTALENMAVEHLSQGAFGEAQRCWQEAVDTGGSPPGEAETMRSAIALAQVFGGDLAGARATLQAQQRSVDASGCPTVRAWHRYVAGEVALVDRPTEAIALLDEAIRLARTVGAEFIEGVATHALVSGALRLGDRDTALLRLPEVIRHWQRSGSWTQQWTTLRILVELLVDLGAYQEAAVVLGAADHAEEAATVVGADAARLEAIRARLVSDDGYARGAALRRGEVVERALDAISRRWRDAGATRTRPPRGPR